MPTMENASRNGAAAAVAVSPALVRGENGRVTLGATRRNTGRPAWRRAAAPSRVLLVRGLNRASCDAVFNMFCLYGNVVAVKVLRHGQVLVELEDDEAAGRCVSNLNSLPVDETTEMSVTYFKHSSINGYENVNNRLPDGTPALKNYRTSKLNRFPKRAMRLVHEHRTAAPSKILHFFNAPLDVCGTDIHKAVTDAVGRADAVQSIVILPKKLRGAKSSMGLIQMKSIDSAAKAILHLNHTTFGSSRSRFPFLMKLCFSKWTDIQQTSTSSSDLVFSTAPRMPWLQHGCEQVVSTTVFPVTRMTTVPTGSDSSWTLWDMAEKVTKSVGPATGSAAEESAVGQPRPELSGLEDALDESRHQLGSAYMDDQGDVLPEQNDDPHDAVANVPVALVGPLGDARSY